jgi:ankyrin repeat protein
LTTDEQLGVIIRRAAANNAVHLEAILTEYREQALRVINQQGLTSGKTAFHFAIEKSLPECVAVLRRFNARDDIADLEGNTAAALLSANRELFSSVQLLESDHRAVREESGAVTMLAAGAGMGGPGM